MENCLFCRIAKKEIKADIVFEDNQVIAFRDLNPQAPVHVLVVPKKHIATLNDLEENDKALAGHMLFTAKKIAQKEGIAEGGYRAVFNVNRDAGQAVFHIHLHILGGRGFGWPPG